MTYRQDNVSIRSVSTTSGNPCTFWGGMQSAATGCATGAIAQNPVSGCVTGAFQATASHTVGCVQVNRAEPGTYPTPMPNSK